MRRGSGNQRLDATRARRALARRCALACAIAVAPSASAIETGILAAPAAAPSAETAYAIGVDGTTVVLGAPGENATAGGVYAFDCASLPCAPPARIAPDDIAANDAFGTAVAISGDTLAATAPGPEPGAAYVYVRDGGWAEQARLTPTGGSSGERFGISASLSGDRLAVGADRAGNGAGAVYVFVRSGTAWVQEARLTASDASAHDAFGSSVAIDGDTIVAGAPYRPSGVAGSYANGAAYAFVRGGGGWSEQAILTAAVSASGDLFGFSVDVAADRAVIGAPYAAASRGTAFVFSRSGTSWTQAAQLAAAAGAAGDELGWSVALGQDSVIVGAPFAGQLAGAPCGASYVFDASSFAEAGGGTVSAPAANDLTGWSVAASGLRWASGAPGRAIAADEHAGVAYWFDPTITIFHSGFDLAGSCIADPGQDQHQDQHQD